MLSGGELQRFAISVVVVQKADVYMFDEPSSYLDVKQRLKVWNIRLSLLLYFLQASDAHFLLLSIFVFASCN